MDDATFEQLCRLYEERLHLPANAVCSRQCDAHIKNPLPIWHIGSNFFGSNPRVLFVGKPHRGTPGVVRPSGVIDPRDLVESDLQYRSWAYWGYTREIASRLFGSEKEGWESIALTNLVKCTNVDAGWKGAPTADQTTRRMAECCIRELGVISAEIFLLKPTHVVFYTAALFPDLLERLPPFRWRTSKRTRRRCGRKSLPWWERTGTADGFGRLQMLVTGHPERMRKEDFVRLVVRWVGISGSRTAGE